MDSNFGGVIWTNHALDRLRERKISQSDAWATWRNPDQSRKGSNIQGSWVYYRTCGSERIEVVAKQNDKKEWIILSVWSRPVYDKHPKTHKKSLARKIFEILFVKPDRK